MKPLVVGHWGITPGQSFIHGYSLGHAFGAALDNPGLIVACCVGDSEAETGPLATAWQSNKFLDAAADGAVLPILHLNGYKTSNPAALVRITRGELEQVFCGCGWTPCFVEGDDPDTMHERIEVDPAARSLTGFRERCSHAQDTPALIAGGPAAGCWPVPCRTRSDWLGPRVRATECRRMRGHRVIAAGGIGHQ